MARKTVNPVTRAHEAGRAIGVLLREPWAREKRATDVANAGVAVLGLLEGLELDHHEAAGLLAIVGQDIEASSGDTTLMARTIRAVRAARRAPA